MSDVKPSGWTPTLVISVTAIILGLFAQFGGMAYIYGQFTATTNARLMALEKSVDKLVLTTIPK